MDAEEEREKKRVDLSDDPSNKAMVQRAFHLLPEEILLEILSRLPIISLMRFKTTSHAGYDLIANPGLPAIFHNRVSDSNPCLILFDYNFHVPRGSYFVDIEDCSRRVRKIDPLQLSKVYDLVGSCNGLLCISLSDGSSESYSLLIYNPFVGDAVRVPAANPFPNQREVFGFGFHPRTGEFKVVRIVWFKLDVEDVEEVKKLTVQVFTVGTTEWRTKGDRTPQLAGVAGPPDAIVEGSLHWVNFVAVGGNGAIFGIISFELADEVFVEILHPPCQRFVSRPYSLSVINGCLSAARLVDTLHFDIWVMKQYRVKEHWVKQFSFDPCSPGKWPGYLRIFPEFICALKNGEILLRYDDNSLVSYDPVEKRFKNLQMSGLPKDFVALPFQPSLFSAKATMDLQL
ncbi:hypothetical protein SLE2022_321470 [Rubroshorea leprosula]